VLRLMLKVLKCPLCGAELERTPQGWRCPRTGFYFRVERGAVSPRPMWGVEAPPAAEGAAPIETFEAWLAEHGISQEMYKDLDEKTKKDLKVAFWQRASFSP